MSEGKGGGRERVSTQVGVERQEDEESFGRTVYTEKGTEKENNGNGRE